MRHPIFNSRPRGQDNTNIELNEAVVGGLVKLLEDQVTQALNRPIANLEGSDASENARPTYPELLEAFKRIGAKLEGVRSPSDTVANRNLPLNGERRPGFTLPKGD